MYKIEWYSEDIKQPHCGEIGFDNLWGKKYFFICNEELGYAIYNDSKFKLIQLQLLGNLDKPS